MGAKFQRALVSEVVGVEATTGVRTSSRIDPTQIQKNAGPLYETGDGNWTLEAGDARVENKKPVKVGKEGKPSEANLGNVLPTIAEGGVTIKHAIQTTVLSLPALRRLSFPLKGKIDVKGDDAARTALAGLGLCAAMLAREQGGDLRSRCQLHPTAPIVWELLDRPGEEPVKFSLASRDAISLYTEAIDAARKAGLPWMEKELVLQASPQLVELVRRSQELAARGTIEEVTE
jgi:CRISPR-associated protein Csb1